MVTELVQIVVRERGAKATSAQIAGVGRASRSAATSVRLLTTALAGLGIGLGLTAATRTIIEFEQRMAGVRAITRATDTEFASLNETARTLGATTVFSASEAAQGLRLFAQAGFDVAESQDAISGALNLAVAGELDLASAVDIAASAVRGFALDASEAGRVADVLAATATGANTTVFALGEALKFVAPVASAAGLSIEETSAALGVLSDAGLKGTLAGTGLRRILAELLAPSSEAADIFEQFGLTVDDLNPRFNSLADIVERLTPILADPANAFALFEQRGGPAAIALSRLRDRFEELGIATQNADGRAQEIADTLIDTLGGSFKLLRSALEEATLQFGESGFAGTLRDVVDFSTAVVTELNGISSELGQTNPEVVRVADAFRLLGDAGLSSLLVVEAIGDVFNNLGASELPSLSQALTTVARSFIIFFSGVETGIRSIVAGASAIRTALVLLDVALGRQSEQAGIDAINRFDQANADLQESAFRTEAAIRSIDDAFTDTGEGAETAESRLAQLQTQLQELEDTRLANVRAEIAGLLDEGASPQAGSNRLTDDQKSALEDIVSLTDRLRVQREGQVDPLSAQLERLRQQSQELQALAAEAGETADITEGRLLLEEQVNAVLAERGRLNLEQSDLLNQLQANVEQLATLAPAAALALQDAADAAVEAGGGVATINGELSRLVSDSARQLEEASEAQEQVADNIAGSVTSGLTRGLQSVRDGGSFSDFGNALADSVAGNLDTALSDLLGGLQEDLSGLLSDLGGSLGGLGGTIGGLAGITGSLIAGALRDSDAQIERNAVKSAVTSSQELRGVVAGPTNIPVLEVGNFIEGALDTTNDILRAILEVDEAQLAALRGVLRGGGVTSTPGDSAASDLLTTSPTLS